MEGPFRKIGKLPGITRREARLISRDDQDRPNYGGTISDNSLIRYLKELKNRGYEILIYPMLLLDVKGKPWRGKITGKSQDLARFFSRYNQFITHYAELTKDLADGFIIGSEFKGITKIQKNGEYPAVTEFTKLAKVIKEIFSKETIVTYAANWDEYHSHNGDYYMDQLWSSPNIDVVGIDGYFPLTDRIKPPLGFSQEEIIKGWSSGEGYDYFYQDSESHTGKTDYEDSKWAWKNIQKWWEEEHLSKSGKKTPWQPKMKKIWFTEYGFPSVDGCSNQPNVFIDKSSEESRFPFFSRGNIDFKAQAVAIEGTLDKWFGSDMVENMFLWAWDARPFPYFPNLLSVWSDGLSWEFSHEVQGKLFFPTLTSIISDIMLKANYKKSDFDSTKLTQLVEGFILNESYNARSALEILQQAYLFDAVVEGKKIIFHPKFTDTKVEIKADDLVPVNNSSFAITRSSDAPSKIEVLYLSKMRNYELSSTYSELNSSDKVVKTFFLPLILSDHHAKAISSTLLYHYWQSRTKYTLNLPLNWVRLSPADVIKFSTATTQHVIKITSIDEGSVLQVSGISHDNSIYDVGADNFTTSDPPLNNFSGKTEFEALDLPTNNEGISIAKYGREKNWKGAVLSVSNDEGRSFEAATNLEGNTTLGICLSNLPDGPYSITDEGSEIIVILTSGELESITEEALLSGGNLAKIGEEILQFRNAEFISENKYKLSGFLRGRFGSENYVDKHDSQEKFILLNNLVDSIPLEDNFIGRKRLYQATSYGEIEGESKEFIYRNNYLKPFSVAHISGAKDEIGNIIIRWVRRSRIESDLRDYVDVPLGEEFEKYDVEIYQDSRLIRNFNVENSTTLTYPLEEQLDDLGTSPNELDIKIYQLSAIVGRGTSEMTHLTLV